MIDYNPRQHLTTLKGKPYLEVRWRLMWLTETQPKYTIDTDFVALTDTHAIARATVTLLDADGTVVRRATDYKREDKAHFQDFMEKASTGAIGRALGALGFGTQFAVEFAGEGDADRPVDAPVDGRGRRRQVSSGEPDPEEPEGGEDVEEPLPKVTQHDIKRLHALGSEHGLSHEALHDLALGLCGVASLRELRVDQCNELEAWAVVYDATGWDVVIAYVRKIAKARDLTALTHIGNEIAAGAIDDERLRGVFRRKGRAFQSAA